MKNSEASNEQREKEKKIKKKIYVKKNTQLRNSKCLTFVFYFYQKTKTFSYDSLAVLLCVTLPQVSRKKKKK